MKIPTTCPFCKEPLNIDPSSTLCYHSNPLRLIEIILFCNEVFKITLIIETTQLWIYPSTQEMYLVNPFNPYQNLVSLPFIDIDPSSEEDILNKLKLIQTFI